MATATHDEQSSGMSQAHDEPFIPHIEEPHPATGVVNSKLGIWVFLASEVMLFGALFSSYILLRVGSDTWNAEAAHAFTDKVVRLAAVNTAILITSSVTVVLAWVSLKLKDFNRFRLYLGITVLCSFGFLVIKFIEYSEKISAGHVPSYHNLYGIYFTMTGLHGLHVVGGAVVMIWLLTGGSKLYKTNPTMFTNRVEATGLYWHFVDLVWIFLFPSIYLL